MSELEPLDCIECLQVSRHWRHFIPAFASRPFRDITLHEDSARLLSFLHIFARFVRTARLKFDRLRQLKMAMDHVKSCTLLQKLGM